MRALLLLVLFLATTSHGSEPAAAPLVYDVTTIYRLEEPLPLTTQDRGVNVSGALNHPGSVEVHARTNARGLPFALQDGAIRGPEVGISIPECSRTTTDCGWTTQNFTVKKSSFDKKPPLQFDRKEQDHFEFELPPSQYSEGRPFHSPLRFNFKTRAAPSSGDGRSYLAVFLITQGGQVHSGDMYYLRIRHRSQAPTYLVKCTPSNYDLNYYLANDETRRCSKQAEVNLDWDFTPGELLSFSVSLANGRLVLKAYRGGWETTLFDWTDSSAHIDVANVVFATSRLDGVVTGPDEYSVLQLTNEAGSMLSPPLPPGLEGLCVSLIYYAENEASIELQLNQDKTISTIWTNSKQTRQTGAWAHVNVVANIPNIPSSETVVVVKATKQTGSTLLIQRVAGCNAEEPEDVLVLPEETSLTVQSPGADVAHNIVYTKADENTCRNGGVKVVQKNDLKSQSGGCICPAGFTGENCEKACGANSYGADCDGVCSETERGCRGLILCLPVLGCDCAPGYKGLYCNNQCERGEYGAGCRQSCGKCAGGQCDIYSGVCHQGCMAGHFPPLCNQTYAHVSLAPRVVVTHSFYNVSVSVNLLRLTGQGDPQFYQVQYKDENATEWQMEVPQPMPTNPGQHVTSLDLADGFVSVGEVTGLKPGTSYTLRVVLIDKTGAIYQGENVPTTSFSTPCTVPEKVDYNTNTHNHEILDFVNVNEDGFELAWQFPSDKSTWCPVIGYEVHVKMGWQWKTHKVPADVRRMSVDQLLPGRKYTVKVRAVTTKGAAAFSQSRVVTTQERAPDHVVGLKENEATGDSLTVSWSPPRHPAGTVRWYQVTYKCLYLMACPEEDCSGSAGNIEVMSTSALLDGLLPYAVYNISVAGFSGFLGSTSSLVTATIPSVPEVEPLPAHPSVVNRSNSSLVVQWAPPASCRHLHGYLTGYRYELVSPGQQQPLLSGATTNCSATFNNLKPYSDFVVRVYVDNSAGWSKSHPLEIHSKTKATTPESVENLTVYKRGRRMLGLRWSPPRMTYGTLQSFTITHHLLVGSDKPISETIKPSPCSAWPQFYCHTFSNLKPDTEYTLAVEPRNSEVEEDGKEATIVGTTKEGAPGAPSYLRIKNHTDTTLTVEWGLPDLINGHLRSFLVNIEETDSINSTDCCQYFPIREVVVTSENIGYEFQMTGLKPASSYEVSVSAKTVAMGAAVTLTGHTRPPTPVLTQAPTMAEPIVTGSTLVVHVAPAIGYQDELVSGYLLLLADDSQDVNPYPITNEWLWNELSNNQSISLVAEFTQSEVHTGRKLELHSDRPMVSGRFGLMGLPTLTPDNQYRFVWALVLDYCGALSVGQIQGDVFTVAQPYEDHTTDRVML